ncbi:MAG: cation diffusion facilitator family transporter [Rhodospirillum sp.]|nr:cation diffusion facilitator family transporter [Rhodospirillum sp.]MCF8490519.1 cation diffusion facilitator family transporter [Rhodospirillum sp.]
MPSVDLGGSPSQISRIKRERLTRMAMLVLLPSLAASLVAVLTSSSSALLADLLLTLLDFGTLTVTWMVARRALRPAGGRFQFGLGRMESLASVAAALFMIAATAVIIASAIERIQVGQAPTGTGLLVGLVFNGTYLLVNAVVLRGFLKQSKSDPSPIVKAQIHLFSEDLISNLILSVAMLVVLAAPDTLIGRHADPVASLLTICVMSVIALRMVKVSLGDLLDAACGEDVQMPMTRALIKHFDDYDQLLAFRTRRAADTAIVEVVLSFPPETPVKRIETLRAQLEAMVRQDVESIQITVVPRVTEHGLMPAGVFEY